MRRNDAKYKIKDAGLPLAFFCILVSLYLLATFFLVKTESRYVDEIGNYQLIMRHAHRPQAPVAYPQVSVFPGYHIAMAAVVWLSGSTSIHLLRAVAGLFSALSIVVFGLLVKTVHGTVTWRRLCLFIFLPIAMPFFFLVYTDIPSMLLVLVSVYLGLVRRYTLAGVACCLSIAVRQNNLVWMPMILMMTYFAQEQFAVSVRCILQFLALCWPFALGAVATAVIFAATGSLVAGDRSAHPSFILHSGNVFFLLMWYCLLFLPGIIHRLFVPPHPGGRRNWMLVALIAALFVLYMFTFRNDHPYNTFSLFFIGNVMLRAATCTTAHKVFFFIPVALAVYDIAVTPLARRRFVLLYPFTVLYLAPSWLMQSRYYMIPFALYLAFRKEGNKTVDIVTWILYLLASSFIILSIGAKVLFP